MISIEDARKINVCRICLEKIKSEENIIFSEAAHIKCLAEVSEVHALRGQIALLLESVRELNLEIDRLKRGVFSKEELQELCHHMDETQYKEFCEGCSAYQQQLFGRSEVGCIYAAIEKLPPSMQDDVYEQIRREG